MEADKTESSEKREVKGKGAEGDSPRDCLFCPYLKRTVGVI